MKTKKQIDIGFKPSIYQEKIFDFVQHGVGNAVIIARAGSGKTTTSVAAMKMIPSKLKVIFLAFNKSVEEEITHKLKNYDNISVRTSHSLGYSMINTNVEGDIELDEYKYRTYLKNNISELSSVRGVHFTRLMLENYIENITQLVHFARVNLAQTSQEIEALAVKYDIPIGYDEADVTLKLMEWGKTQVNKIDYTDMIWLPVELNMKPMYHRYDWVVVDECQDQTIAMIELFKKCFKRGTRFIGVGDDFQTINGFAGSSETSFQYLTEQPNTVTMELPICYRCPQKVVELAQTFVSDIQWKDGAEEGEIKYDCLIKDIMEGDMVLARSKSPLMRLYVKLLRRGVKCFIKGKDIGYNLIQRLESVDEENLSPNLEGKGVFSSLYDNLFEARNKMMNKYGLDFIDATLSEPIMEMYDSICTLLILSERCKTKKDLIAYIEKIFREEEFEDAVMLSTVHKAKGLEANNVFILCPSSMPSKRATKDWEKQQEQNIIYVAYTRPKKILGFVSENEVKPFGALQEPIDIVNELVYIEHKVCELLGKQPIEQKDVVDIARFNLKTQITEIEDLHKDDNVQMNLKTKDEDEDILNELENLLM